MELKTIVHRKRTVEIDMFDDATILPLNWFNDHQTKLKCSICGELIDDENVVVGQVNFLSRFYLHKDCADEKTLFLVGLHQEARCGFRKDIEELMERRKIEKIARANLKAKREKENTDE